MTVEKLQNAYYITSDMADHGKTLSFRDPDGNLVQLYQRAPK